MKLAKKKKQPTQKNLTTKLDKVFGEIVRNIGKCVRCGKTEYLQAAHIFTRKKRAIRWDFLNSLCLCVGCHYWAHDNPLYFRDFVKEVYGEENYNEIHLKGNLSKKWTLDEKIELLEKLNKIKNNLNKT